MIPRAEFGDSRRRTLHVGTLRVRRPTVPTIIDALVDLSETVNVTLWSTSNPQITLGAPTLRHALRGIEASAKMR